MILLAIAKAEETKDPAFLAIPLFFYIGLRIAECLALTYADIDKNNNVININKMLVAKTERKEDGTWTTRQYEVVDHLKSNGDERNVVVIDECFEIINKIKSIQEENGELTSKLFPGVTPSNVQFKLYRLCESLDFVRRSPHKWRKLYTGLESKVFTEKHPLKTLPEFLDVVMKLMDSDIEVLCKNAYYVNPLMIWGVISFNTNDLVNTRNKKLFADFDACCRQLTGLYGEELAVSRHTYDDNVYMDYYFLNDNIKKAIEILGQVEREATVWSLSQEEMEKIRKDRLEELAEVVFEINN